MAEALVGGAFLSGFINVVFDRLISPEAFNLIKGKKLDPELVERLKTALIGAEALLVDAELKQFHNPLVKNWLDSLKDAVYKADDLLDHFFTKAATENKVRPSLPRFLNFGDRKMVNKIEEQIRRIEDLEKRKYILGLEVVARDKNYSSWRTPSTSLAKGNIYGREDAQQDIIKIINGESESQVSVIPIVGIGGLGKTTLAQWVYNNEDLMKGFEFKAWVCISEQFDMVKVTQTILEGATSSTDLNLLQLDLKQKLSNKKFFIVLDDVWSDDADLWNSFKTPFQYGAKGSTILVTTRTEEVASVVQTCAPYFLKELSDDYCWLVFADNAKFPKSSGNSALEDIGREIVKKCDGLPLAAETLGRLLTKHDTMEWDRVLKSNIWDFPMNKSHLPIGRQKGSFGIKELGELSNPFPTLKLTNLENVANCEEAMGARLMDKTNVDNLILKWLDGGDIVSNSQTDRDIFDKLQPHHGLKELRIDGYRGTRFPNWVGHSSYSNMTRVSLVGCRSCCMLSSLGQLSSLKSLEIEHFDILENIGVEFYKNEDDSSSVPPFPLLEHLTFRSMPCWEVWSQFGSDNAFPKLRELQIIDCPRLKGDLPNHLPALDTLRCQQVESMSRAMSISHRISSITISDCLSATSLPWDCLLKSLSSLRIENCRKLEFGSQQQQMHKLKGLELEDSCDSLTLLQLEAFPELMYLKIRGCENLESIALSESQSPPMSNLYHFAVMKCKKLKSLPCHMNSHFPRLMQLHIHDCPDIDSFPEGGLPPSLKTLEIRNCEKLVSNLSSMGVLESLIFLKIEGNDCPSIKSFPNEGFLPGLLSLTRICLEGFPNVETLECKDLLRLTSLQTLEIESCPKLENIAGERLPHSLSELRIKDCPLLAKRCKKEDNHIWPKISHIRRILVDQTSSLVLLPTQIGAHLLDALFPNNVR